MTNPLFYPTGAWSGFRLLEPDQPRVWALVYHALTKDIRREVRTSLSKFDIVDRWRGCAHRVVLRNLYADIDLTVGNGSAAVWMVRRPDAEFRRRAEWGDHAAAPDAWLVRTSPRFAEALTRLGCKPAPAELAPLAA